MGEGGGGRGRGEGGGGRGEGGGTQCRVLEQNVRNNEHVLETGRERDRDLQRKRERQGETAPQDTGPHQFGGCSRLS